MACSAGRSASSVLVRRLAFMFAVTPGDVGNGYGLPPGRADSLATLCAASCDTRESLVPKPPAGTPLRILRALSRYCGSPPYGESCESNKGLTRVKFLLFLLTLSSSSGTIG